MKYNLPLFTPFKIFNGTVKYFLSTPLSLALCFVCHVSQQIKPSFTGEQRWHWLLHRDALHHAPPRLHLHHSLQVGDDKAYGRGHDGPLPCLRHHLPRPL